MRRSRRCPARGRAREGKGRDRRRPIGGARAGAAPRPAQQAGLPRGPGRADARRWRRRPGGEYLAHPPAQSPSSRCLPVVRAGPSRRSGGPQGCRSRAAGAAGRQEQARSRGPRVCVRRSRQRVRPRWGRVSLGMWGLEGPRGRRAPAASSLGRAGAGRCRVRCPLGLGQAGKPRTSESGRGRRCPGTEVLPGRRPLTLGGAAAPQAETSLLRDHCFPFPARAEREMVLRNHLDLEVSIPPPCELAHLLRGRATQVWGRGAAGESGQEAARAVLGRFSRRWG